MKKPTEHLVAEATLVSEYAGRESVERPTDSELRELCRLYRYNPRFENHMRTTDPIFHKTFINNLMRRFMEIVDKDTGRKSDEPIRAISQVHTAAFVAKLLKGSPGKEPISPTAAYREIAAITGKTTAAVSEAYKNTLRKAKQE
ncbi:hypothetical protein ACN2CC_15335 [Mesorhizobium muleiense]|uniref:hypothetical protein n=1 Tax=Mesorhizobium muleiense TaxID=1004279 RepID=UPI003AFA4480